MVQDSPKQLKRVPQTLLAGAVREVAGAIRSRERQERDKHRVEAGKHLMQLGNLAAGALLFGQAFSGFPFNLRVAILGVVVLVSTYVWATHLMKGGGQKWRHS